MSRPILLAVKSEPSQEEEEGAGQEEHELASGSRFCSDGDLTLAMSDEDEASIAMKFLPISKLYSSCPSLSPPGLSASPLLAAASPRKPLRHTKQLSLQSGRRSLPGRPRGRERQEEEKKSVEDGNPNGGRKGERIGEKDEVPSESFIAKKVISSVSLVYARRKRLCLEKYQKQLNSEDNAEKTSFPENVEITSFPYEIAEKTSLPAEKTCFLAENAEKTSLPAVKPSSPSENAEKASFPENSEKTSYPSENAEKTSFAAEKTSSLAENAEKTSFPAENVEKTSFPAVIDDPSMKVESLNLSRLNLGFSNDESAGYVEGEKEIANSDEGQKITTQCLFNSEGFSDFESEQEEKEETEEFEETEEETEEEGGEEEEEEEEKSLTISEEEEEEEEEKEESLTISVDLFKTPRKANQKPASGPGQVGVRGGLDKGAPDILLTGDSIPKSKEKDITVYYKRKRKSQHENGTSSLRRVADARADGNSDKEIPDTGLGSIISTASARETSQKSVFRRWREVNLAGVNPHTLVGQKCKVYWPMDEDWYQGVIAEYSGVTQKHRVDYDDGDDEELALAKESVKLYLSHKEWIFLTQQSNSATSGKKKIDYQEMAALAVGVEVHGEYGHGEVVWAKIKGHPLWPAVVVDEEHASACGFETPVREGLLAIQFFGSYDYARISSKQAVPFSYGLLWKYHSKCNRPSFERGLEEAERYIRERTLPESMVKPEEKMLEGISSNEAGNETDTSEEDQDFMGDERMHKVKKSIESLFTCPIKLGSLQVLNLGKIVNDSEHFHNEREIWTEGYIAIRRFPSTKDPERIINYRSEVLRNPSVLDMPLFRVTPDDSDVVEGPTPSSCWKKIYRRLEKARCNAGIIGSSSDRKQLKKSGSYMFGFTHPRVWRLIQALPNARVCSKYTRWLIKSDILSSQHILPIGYKPVEIQWKHLDRCSVCYSDEEYTNNMFLQCDKCRMMVHMHCYGQLEPPDGHLWLCKLCRPGAPPKIPPCCLCPIQGGAMKETTDGRWAHLTCALWVPETCLVDIKRMEPIDGLKFIIKDRWKLTCSICKVQYGVCIQCSDLNCRVAYHILCARAAGLFTEVQEDHGCKERSLGEELDQPVKFLSYCRKHRRPKKEQEATVQQIAGFNLALQDGSAYVPPLNYSGCARCEPYNFDARRGRQEPEVQAAASNKRLFVEKMPYLVSSISRNKLQGELQTQILNMNGRTSQINKCPNMVDIKTNGNSNDFLNASLSEDNSSVFSMSERFSYMRSTVRQRLTFGKSAIHGWGIFTKQAHRAGDMVIEYAGETVRPIVADLRERQTYNSLVGAGTYMFRIDDERVVDATRVGSIAHLINHACEPNCYSRVVSVNGEEHIIIFAKRDIELGEELTYDYRFTSKGERLPCYCGYPGCRGSVNLDDGDEEAMKVRVPRSELMEWVPVILHGG